MDGNGQRQRNSTLMGTCILLDVSVNELSRLQGSTDEKLCE